MTTNILLIIAIIVLIIIMYQQYQYLKFTREDRKRSIESNKIWKRVSLANIEGKELENEKQKLLNERIKIENKKVKKGKAVLLTENNFKQLMKIMKGKK
jgi:predicted Holliday junction resolvase-like endonuclease